MEKAILKFSKTTSMREYHGRISMRDGDVREVTAELSVYLLSKFPDNFTVGTQDELTDALPSIPASTSSTSTDEEVGQLGGDESKSETDTTTADETERESAAIDDVRRTPEEMAQAAADLEAQRLAGAETTSGESSAAGTGGSDQPPGAAAAGDTAGAGGDGSGEKKK